MVIIVLCMEGSCRVRKLSSPNKYDKCLDQFSEIIIAFCFLEENDVNPRSQIMQLLTGSELKNKVDCCLNFGIAPKIQSINSNILTRIIFLLN